MFLRIAIFDFDGTVYANETFKLLMEHLKHHPTYHSNYRTFYRQILPLYIGYKTKIVSEATMKERSMQLYVNALGSLNQNELQHYFAELKASMQNDFNHEVVSRIHQHHTEGIFTMLVSGAYTPLLHAVTDGLPFDAIIGTEVPYTIDQQLDRQKSIYHIQGKRKNEKIMEALQSKDIDWTNSYAYGDSYSDLSVLELVGSPVAVKPKKRLAQIANARDWEII